ncbi:MAG: asparagine synthase (glutamine-hydrolyzing) [Aureliella sp.]
MCGIAGYVDWNNQTPEGVLGAMTDALEHRGPDARGELRIPLPQGTLALGHRRLAIIDLSGGGSQPMSRGSRHIVFNGEIYNYREIKKELEGLGQRFVSSSDTEVILAAVEQWGVADAVSRFNGMFAFALFDDATGQLVLVRDRAGVKPLYYCRRNGLLLFASELKALLQHPAFDSALSNEAITSFFRYGYVPSTECIFASARKVPPGHFLRIDLATGEESLTKYWDIIDSFNQSKLPIGLVDAIEQLEELLQSAFEYRMVSDVPVGVFLSGGYDSSIVTAILQKHAGQRLKTFTIGFEDDDFNEAPYARAIAERLGTDHTEHLCTVSEAQQIIPTLADYYDEPFGDASAIPTMLVSRIARQSVKVALSADAGDELFAGYNRYANVLNFAAFAERIPRCLRISALFGLLARIPLPRQAGQRTLRNLQALYGDQTSQRSLVHIGNHVFRDSDLSALLADRFRPKSNWFDAGDMLTSGNDVLNRMLALDYKTYLPDDILTKVDRATMAVSLEGREPLLDHRLAEFTARLPSEFKISGTERKYILKRIAHKHLPEPLLNRPKKGFSVPYFRWLRSDLKSLVDHLLEPRRIQRQGILNAPYVEKYKKMFFTGNEKTNVGMWNLLMFQMWLERWQPSLAV